MGCDAMACGVYKLTFPNGKFYIGSSIEVKRRIYSHGHELKTGRHKNDRLVKNFKEFGSFKGELIICCLPADLLFYEQICIDGLRPHLNKSRTAGKIEFNDGIRKKISEAQKGNSYGTGHVKSPEWKVMMRERFSGKPLKPETIAKLKLARKGNKNWLGKKHSEETKKKISIAKTSHKQSEETTNKRAASLSGKERGVYNAKFIRRMQLENGPVGLHLQHLASRRLRKRNLRLDRINLDQGHGDR